MRFAIECKRRAVDAEGREEALGDKADRREASTFVPPKLPSAQAKVAQVAAAVVAEAVALAVVDARATLSRKATTS